MSLTHPAARIAFGSRGSCVRAFPRHSKAFWLSPCCRWSKPTVVRSSGLSGENSSASCTSLTSSYRQHQGTNRQTTNTRRILFTFSQYDWRDRTEIDGRRGSIGEARKNSFSSTRNCSKPRNYSTFCSPVSYSWWQYVIRGLALACIISSR